MILVSTIGLSGMSDIEVQSKNTLTITLRVKSKMAAICRRSNNKLIYCGSGNIQEVLIFTNFARTNLRICESREKYYYNCAIYHRNR